MGLKNLNQFLPKMLKVDGKNYKLDVCEYCDSEFGVTYAEYDGNFFNWDNKPISFFYKIVDEIPPAIEYAEGDLKDATIYKTSFYDVLNDCLDKLKQWTKDDFVVLTEIVPKEEQFYRELTSLLNKYSKENESNTPDFLLASYLIRCLDAFNSITNSRENWYGRK